MKHLKHLYANHAECDPSITGYLVSHATDTDCPWCTIAAKRLKYPGVQAHIDQLRARADAKAERKVAA